MFTDQKSFIEIELESIDGATRAHLSHGYIPDVFFGGDLCFYYAWMGSREEKLMYGR